MNGAPVYWNSPTYGPAIYVWPAGDPLKVFRLVGGLFATPASAQSTVAGAGRHARRDAVAVGQRQRGRAPASCGRRCRAAATPTTRRSRASCARTTRATSRGSSGTASRTPTRDTLGNFSKFSPPTVANGKVFVASLSNKLVVYGLIGPSAGNTAPVVNAGADQSLAVAGHATLTGTATDDGNPDSAGPAHDDVEPGERAGRRHVRRAERAVDDGDVHGSRRLHDPPQRLRRRGHDAATT